MKVFIAFEGDYSSRGVVAVFSTKEKAEECSGDVECHELDEMAAHTMHTVYEVKIKAEDGSLVRSSKRTVFEAPSYCHCEVEGLMAIHPRAIGTSSLSEDHALKLAVEAQQSWIRECAMLPKPGIDRVRNASGIVK